MKAFVTILMISNLFIISACQAAKPVSDEIKLQKVPRIVYEIYSNDWYKTQAELWKKEIDKNPTNSEAWYNYYNAHRYGRFEEINSKERAEKLNKIIEDMSKAVPQSYEFNLLSYWNKNDVHDLNPAQKTYEIDPDRPDTYYTFLSYYTMYKDEQNLNKFAHKLYDSQDIEPWLYYYNYNVLMSLEKDAVLITNGDNDTYPIWVLQQVKNVRRDVTVCNISLSTVEKYFESVIKSKYPKIDFNKAKEDAIQKMKAKEANFPAAFIQNIVRQLNENYKEAPIYFALTVYGGNTKPFSDDMYLTGLAYRYSPDHFDNLAYLKLNMENNFLLDYLEFGLYDENRIGKNLSARIERNYIPPMILLAEHYVNAGEKSNAQKWIDLATKIAESTNFEPALKDIKEKFKD